MFLLNGGEGGKTRPEPHARAAGSPTSTQGIDEEEISRIYSGNDDEEMPNSPKANYRNCIKKREESLFVG